MNGLKIFFLGGLGEIGMNCMVLETDEEIIVIDCGIQFSELDHFGVEFMIPDFSYLVERKEKISAFFITHAHEDHIGALPFAFRAGLKAPIYASKFTSLVIRERFLDMGISHENLIRVFEPGDRVKFKKLSARTVAVNHSIVDAVATIYETPWGNIVHTGDFRIDSDPFYGKQMDLAPFQKAGDEGVLLLMSDSTNVEVDRDNHSEKIVYEGLLELLSEAQGTSIITMFSSNVGRMGQILKICEKLDKKVGLAGRSMVQNARLASECGYLENAGRVLVGLENLSQYARKKSVVMTSGCQGEHQSALNRLANGEHKTLDLEPGDQVIFSSKFIPGNEKEISHLINQLYKTGAEVIYDPVREVHVSGHATRPELRRMLDACRPKYFIPVHGEYRHLVRHGKLALEAGVPTENILIAINGDHVEVTPEKCEILEHVESTRILIENPLRNEFENTVLKDRRKLASKGCAFVMLIRDKERGRTLAGPEVVGTGMVDPARWAELGPLANTMARRFIKAWDAADKKKRTAEDLAEYLRIELRRFFKEHLGEKPVVVPLVVDL